jgi:hypothetical protein
MRSTITENDARLYIELIKIRFGDWIDAGYNAPKAIENYDGRGHWGIAWEGGPFEWAYYGTIGSFAYEEREPEFGSRLPIVKVPSKLGHVFSEPANSCVVMLYLDS